jgi:hypothetical protein
MDADVLDLNRRFVKTIMEAAMVEAAKGCYGPFEWTLQGLGMLRTYLGADKAVRLHVWDDRYIFDPRPSELHTHPWDLLSYIVAGTVVNTRYTEATATERYWTGENGAAEYMRQRILCGIGGGLQEEPSAAEKVVLVEQPAEFYSAGDVYKQRADEVHKSNPRAGTVTLVRRTFGEDVDHADVFWTPGGEWITAEPRAATPEEVYQILTNSLDMWFNGSVL